MSNKKKLTELEKINQFKLFNNNTSPDQIINNYYRAGDIHKEIKELILKNLEPNMKLIDLAKYIETIIKEKTNYNQNEPLKGGVAFPVGLSINECAAHWTPNPMENRRLKSDDLIKIDYGVHFDGCIADSAFTFSFDNKFDEFIKICEDATNEGIKHCGDDAILGEIGGIVEEFIESKEVEIDNKVYPLKSVKDLTGHRIMPYMIHGNKTIPNFSCNYPERMKQGEIYALETYPSTGSGRTEMDMECSHYSINTNLLIQEYRQLEGIDKDGNLTPYAMKHGEGKIENPIKMDARENYLWKKIIEMRQTLPFCKRWLKEAKIDKYQLPLINLVKKTKINAYPPLNDIKGSYVGQFEHTFLVTEKGKVDILT